MRTFPCVMILLFALYGCAGGPVKVEYSPAGQEPFAPRARNAAIAAQSAGQLMQAGYLKLGALKMSANEGDVTSQLLAEAGRRGADLVVLNSSNQRKLIEVGRKAGACVRYDIKLVREEECIDQPDCVVCSRLCKKTLKEEQTCVQRTDLGPELRPAIVSEGELWRYEPDLARKQE